MELFFSMTSSIEALKTVFDSVQLLMIIMQVYNFILIMTYLTISPEYAGLSTEHQVFGFWVYIEGSVICGTIVTVIVFIMVRTCERIKLELSVDREDFDHQ